MLQRGGATLQAGVGRADLEKHRVWYKPSSTPYERAFRALRDVNPITRHFAFTTTVTPFSKTARSQLRRSMLDGQRPPLLLTRITDGLAFATRPRPLHSSCASYSTSSRDFPLRSDTACESRQCITARRSVWRTARNPPLTDGALGRRLAGVHQHDGRHPDPTPSRPVGVCQSHCATHHGANCAAL